jgi:hypothetical protein
MRRRNRHFALRLGQFLAIPERRKPKLSFMARCSPHPYSPPG